MTNTNTNENTMENLADLVGEAGEMPVWAVELRDQAAEARENFEKMTALLREKHAQNEALKSRLEHAEHVAGLQSDQLDQFGDAVMGLIGDKVEALAESVASKYAEQALEEFEISQYEYEIGEMIDDRLPEGLDDESRADDLKAAIKEVLSGATVSLDLE